MQNLSNKTALVTGANSGLGYEAAAQLAEAGFGTVILACRTLEKAEGARKTLIERTQNDPFETLAVDVGRPGSAEGAAQELIDRGVTVDALLLNAGMVADDAVQTTPEGIELSFAASVVGHHVLTQRLVAAERLPLGARVVIAGSEAANNDLPKMMEAYTLDFVTGAPKAFGDDLEDAMLRFARGDYENFRGMPHYTTVKVFTAWWAAAMAKKHGERVSFFNVSPGANMDTNAARNVTGFKKFLFTVVMPAVGPIMGMSMPTAKGAKRYVDVLLERGSFQNGRTYTSAPKKMVGPLHERTEPHLLDEVRQDVAWKVLNELSGVDPAPSLSAVG